MGETSLREAGVCPIYLISKTARERPGAGPLRPLEVSSALGAWEWGEVGTGRGPAGHTLSEWLGVEEAWVVSGGGARRNWGRGMR